MEGKYNTKIREDKFGLPEEICNLCRYLEVNEIAAKV